MNALSYVKARWAESSSKTLRWNYKEVGHLANQCTNDPAIKKDTWQVIVNCFKPVHIVGNQGLLLVIVLMNLSAIYAMYQAMFLAPSMTLYAEISRDCLSVVICNCCGYCTWMLFCKALWSATIPSFFYFNITFIRRSQAKSSLLITPWGQINDTWYSMLPSQNLN